MSGRTGRTQDCSAADARGRLAKARKFLEAGELVQDLAEEGDEESASVSAALFVLAGIAAADAARRGRRQAPLGQTTGTGSRRLRRRHDARLIGTANS